MESLTKMDTVMLQDEGKYQTLPLFLLHNQQTVNPYQLSVNVMSKLTKLIIA